MRTFEIALVVAIFVSLVASAAALSKTTANSILWSKFSVAALILAVVALLLHLGLEGAHWQMLPAYFALLPAAFMAVSTSSRSGHLSWFALGIAVVSLAATCVASCIVPMFRLPIPTGPYAVGTTVVYMVDPNRKEDAGPAPGGNRELVVQIWYPTTASSGKLAPYRRRQETTFESAYQSVLPTNSFRDAPVRRDNNPYPVLLFNPGWTGRRTQNTFLTEELASHGYVVVGIDHTYNSTPVAFPDGRLVLGIGNPKIERYQDTTPLEVEAIGTKETDKQSLDDRFVLDELTRMNLEQGSRWYQTMDTANAGALGHSMGGAVSVETWATDPRVHAALNLDGWTFGTQAALARRVVDAPQSDTPPLLFLYEEIYRPYDYEPYKASPANQPYAPADVEAAVDDWDREHVKLLIERYGGYWLNLKSSNHVTFTDKPLTSPIGRLSGAGPVPTKLGHAIVRDYAVQFFDQALKGKPSALLSAAGQRKYPEIITAIRHTVQP